MPAAVQIRDLAAWVSSLPASFGQLSWKLTVFAVKMYRRKKKVFRLELQLDVLNRGEYF